jgi:hypothetical protein
VPLVSLMTDANNSTKTRRLQRNRLSSYNAPSNLRDSDSEFSGFLREWNLFGQVTAVSVFGNMKP